MIKINLTEEDKYYIIERHVLCFYNKIIKNHQLLNKSKEASCEAKTAIWKILDKSIKILLVGTPLEMEMLVAYDDNNEKETELIKNINSLEENEKQEIFQEIRSIFRYDTFTNRKKKNFPELFKKEQIKSIISGIQDDINKTSSIENTLLNTIKKIKDNLKNYGFEVEKFTIFHKLECLIKHFDFSKKNSLLIDSLFNKIKEIEAEYSWSPYEYIKYLRLNVCPYCNRQYLTLFEGINKKVRPDLDHFYCQSYFPYFSISIFNLIPCCKVCNQSIKIAKKFIRTTKSDISSNVLGNYSEILGLKKETEKKNRVYNCIHPYNNEEFKDIPIFKAETTNGFDDYRVSIDFLSIYENNEKILDNLLAFNTLDAYQIHNQFITKMIQSYQMYSTQYIEDMLNFFEDRKNKPLTKSDVYFLLFNNEYHLEMHSNQVLCKLTKDIMIQLGIEEILSGF